MHSDQVNLGYLLQLRLDADTSGSMPTRVKSSFLEMNKWVAFVWRHALLHHDVKHFDENSVKGGCVNGRDWYTVWRSQPASLFGQSDSQAF